MLKTHKETNMYIKNDEHSKKSTNQAKLSRKSSLFQKFEEEQIDQILKRIDYLENEFLVVKINKIGDLNQEIFELKIKNYDFMRSIKYLAFSIFVYRYL